MADKLGVLGEVAGVTVGTHTIYTCPTGKGAKGKLFFRFTAGANSVVNFFMNGALIASTGAMTAGHFVFSIGTDNVISSVPGAAAPNGQTAATCVAPSGATFMLSAGDLVQYEVVTTALGAASAQFIGAEVDSA